MKHVFIHKISIGVIFEGVVTELFLTQREVSAQSQNYFVNKKSISPLWKKSAELRNRTRRIDFVKKIFYCNSF